MSHTDPSNIYLVLSRTKPNSHALPVIICCDVTSDGPVSPSPEEAHAELCYAKCLLLRAVLNFVEDETLISLVKGGLKVKTCYTCYR